MTKLGIVNKLLLTGILSKEQLQKCFTVGKLATLNQAKKSFSPLIPVQGGCWFGREEGYLF